MQLGLPGALALVGLAAGTAVSAGAATIVLYGDRTVEVEETLADPTDLWVEPSDLPRINDFVLKPEGACLDELCIPVRQDEESELFVRREGKEWFCVTELARRLDQVWVVDRETDVWSFGEIPAVRRSFYESLKAPDFTLPDRQGNPVSLSQFRGKKVMLLAWASW